MYFPQAARLFLRWFEEFDPENTDRRAVSDALGPLAELADFTCGNGNEPPTYRIWKPNVAWQRNQRKAMRLPLNGYRTPLLPNDDGLAQTGCSLAYDLCDFYETLEHVNELRVTDYLAYVGWGYMQARIRAARSMLLSNEVNDLIDPFTRVRVRGTDVRFVSWRTSSSTHATRDDLDVDGPTTLCGGEGAYHKHTHQQWTCYACRGCRDILNRRYPSSSSG
jgi:hypothetical protein